MSKSVFLTPIPALLHHFRTFAQAMGLTRYALLLLKHRLSLFHTYFPCDYCYVTIIIIFIISCAHLSLPFIHPHRSSPQKVCAPSSLPPRHTPLLSFAPSFLPCPLLASIHYHPPASHAGPLSITHTHSSCSCSCSLPWRQQKQEQTHVPDDDQFGHLHCVSAIV